MTRVSCSCRFATSYTVAWCWAAVALGQSGALDVDAGDRFAAKDTLACGVDGRKDADECLAGLSWAPTDFAVDVESAEAGGGDWLIRFPSPRPIGNEVNDLASMEWYAARDDERRVRRARAIVVVHESGRRMTVGRIIAKSLSAQGVHAFLVHLPGYGARRVEGMSDLKLILPAMRQAIADVRRARDAAAALPAVDGSVIGVQGTSLGGFVTATVAGLDHGYDRVFILLAGGNLQDVVLQGGKDAAKVRSKLAAAGVTEEQIAASARQVEPLRLAHRMDPARTWLYSGMFDDVVPPSCSRALAKAAKLPAGHHVELPVDHIWGVFWLPQVVEEMRGRMVGD